MQRLPGGAVGEENERCRKRVRETRREGGGKGSATRAEEAQRKHKSETKGAGSKKERGLESFDVSTLP